MSTYNFHGSIGGNSNFGDNGRIEVRHYGGDGDLEGLATRLTEALHAEQRPDLAARAGEVGAEIAAAAAEGRPVDQGRVRRVLGTVTQALGAGSAALLLAQQLATLVA
ncbi:hypothetical protein ACQYWQ_25120 [Streptomyces sp. P6-2-1]|uniref:hypothetical protein n=1 Tax=Streptomyces sp. P6-2-1 TaxID=3422591 RepID=UPI003D35B9A5